MTPRLLTLADADALQALEAAGNDFPWGPGQFAASLAAGHFGWALEEGGTLAGFALFSQVLDEATLLNIAVAPARRRAGIARRLLAVAWPGLVARGAGRCLLEVRAGNAPAIALYRAEGFTVDGTRRDYYPATQGREDAVLMSRHLPAPNQESR